MKKLQLKSLRCNLKSFGFKGLKFWISDIKFAHERCTYCGWFLHPQRLFKGVKRPGNMTYWKEECGEFACSSCHYLKDNLKIK